MQDLVVRSPGDQLAAILTSAGAEIENAIGSLHNVGIVLDHQNRVSQVAKVVKNFHQPVRIARMQADRWLVEHVESADQARAQRCC